MRLELYLQFKENVLVTDLQMLRPDMLIVLSYLSWWCFKHNLPCRVTSIIDHVETRVSRTHDDGRAVDISTRGFGPSEIERLIKYLNERVGILGAYSKSDGVQRVAVYHDAGMGHHIHIQVSKNMNEEF